MWQITKMITRERQKNTTNWNQISKIECPPPDTVTPFACDISTVHLVCHTSLRQVIDGEVITWDTVMLPHTQHTRHQTVSSSSESNVPLSVLLSKQAFQALSPAAPELWYSVTSVKSSPAEKCNCTCVTVNHSYVMKLHRQNTCHF